MPVIFRFYILHSLIGFALAAVFVGLVMYFNVANLWHLVSTSDIGVKAVIIFWVLNGILFAAAQTGVAVMLMAEDDRDDDASGGAGQLHTPVQNARKTSVFKRFCVTGPHLPVGIYSRGPVYTGGRRVTEPGLRQSQLPRICLRPLECSVSRTGQTPSPASDSP